MVTDQQQSKPDGSNPQGRSRASGKYISRSNTVLVLILIAAMVNNVQACVQGPDDPTCCPSGQVWNFAAHECELDDPDMRMLGNAALNCAADEFSNKTLNPAGGCFCLTNYTWNSVTFRCEFNCSNVANSNKLLESGTVNTCRCILPPAY
jgi:hypothetical protein